MKKITELTEMRWRTVHHRDDDGNLTKGTVDYEAYRKVNVVTTGTKFVHWLFDGLCFMVIVKMAEYVLGMLMDFAVFNYLVLFTGNVVTNNITLFLYPGLYAFFEYTWQKTPAKFLTKSIVIDEYGNKPELRAIALRSLIRLVPFEPFSCIGEPSSGWHDRWSVTWVVPEAELAQIKSMQAEET